MDVGEIIVGMVEQVSLAAPLCVALDVASEQVRLPSIKKYRTNHSTPPITKKIKINEKSIERIGVHYLSMHS